MSEPRGHHLVAQTYQRGFARKRRGQWQVRVLDRRSGKGGIRNVRDVFKKRDWNTIVDAEGNRDVVVEQLLAERIDGPAAPALAALRDGRFPLDPPLEVSLARFIAAQLNRGRLVRQNLSEFLVETHRLMVKMAAHHYSENKWIEVLGRVPSKAEIRRLANNEQHFDVKPTTAYLLETLLSSVEEVAQFLAKRTWTLVTFEAPCLLSSEHPLIHINPSQETGGYGVVTAEQLYLPVSTTRGLVMSHPWTSWPEDRVRGTTELAVRLNWAVFIHPASEHLLMHPDVDGHPLPRPGLLAERGLWPWGEDPEAAPPPALRILSEGGGSGTLSRSASVANNLAA